MVKKSLEQFFQLTSQDQEFQEKLEAAQDPERFLRLFVQLGEQKGYSFTLEEVEAALDAAAMALDGEELSEEQLAAMAGGFSWETIGSKIAGWWNSLNKVGNTR